MHSFNGDYVRKLAARDPEVERHFVEHFTGLMRIKLGRKLRSHQMIEDIRQETFLRVLKSISRDGLENAERLGGFVNSVCHHVMLESLRSLGRHRQMPDDAPDIVDDHANPAQGALGSEQQKIVSEILRKLPHRDRTILRMLFLEEVDKETVCTRMNVNPEYLRVLVHRAKAKLREAMKKRPDQRTIRPGKV